MLQIRITPSPSPISSPAVLENHWCSPAGGAADNSLRALALNTLVQVLLGAVWELTTPDHCFGGANKISLSCQEREMIAHGTEQNQVCVNLSITYKDL